MAIKQKSYEWARRYAPLEIAATLTALVAFMVAETLSGSLATAAFVASICETFAFYSVAGALELRRHERRLSVSTLFTSARNLLVEFGPSEALDTFFIRPLFMYLGPTLTGSLFWGALLGKIASDVVFYLPALLIYELRNQHAAKRTAS